MTEQETVQPPEWAEQLLKRIEQIEERMEKWEEEYLEPVRRDTAANLALSRKMNKVRTRGNRVYSLEEENTDHRVVKACKEAAQKKEGISRKRVQEIFDVGKTRGNQIMEKIVEHNSDYVRHQRGNQPSRLRLKDDAFTPADSEKFSGWL